VHTRLDAKPDLVAKYAAKPGADESPNRPVLAAMLQSIDEQVARIAAALEDLGLAASRDRRADELSHGESQWLEIVMMLSTRPRILLLDEPGAGMAPEEKVRTAMLLRRLAEAVTLVVIEHDLTFVQLVAHSVLVMHRGRVLTEGSFDEISANEDVRRVYLGSSFG